jgi:ABC-type branched-subunit amino acid transport system substrate-binding protein
MNSSQVLVRRSVAAIAVVALAGCGTTVPLAARQSAADSALPGETTAPNFTSAPPGVGGGSAVSGARPGSSGQALRAGGVVPTASVSSPPLAGNQAGKAPSGPVGGAVGVTATTIHLGVFTLSGFSKAGEALGIDAQTGDQGAVARAVIDYLNAHGGMAGRKIVPVVYDYNIPNGTANGASTELQSACAAFTDDNKVYAVATPVSTSGDNSFYDCLSKHGVITSAAGESKEQGFFARRANWFYEPMDMNLTRILSTNVDALSSAGFFGAHPKIAAMIGDTTDERAALKDGLTPALARHGLSLTDYVATNDSSAYSNAVLKFKSEGITHVLFGFLGSPLTFMTNAETQHYYPRYGLHSRSSPGALLQGNAPAAQQVGAMGMGWQPMNDVDGQRDPGVLNARQKLCLQLTKQAGQDPSVRVTALVALWICDAIFFVRDTLAIAPDFTPAGFRAGAEALGTVGVASTFRSTLGPGLLHDGAGAYRVFAYKSDCSCYQYVSPLRPSR